MAKETAHQLGTPLSSIFGWIELLKEDKKIDSNILLSLKKDASRISEVTDRFSKIGSKIKLTEISISLSDTDSLAVAVALAIKEDT